MSLDEIVLRSPFDAHVHLRQGDLLRMVAPLSAATFAGAVVMPNTDPPILGWRILEGYRSEVTVAVRDEARFMPFLTGYFDAAWTLDELLDLQRHGVLAVKFYPKGLTTNSQHGCDPDDPRVLPVLEILEELGIPLCVHAEAPGYHEDREFRFIPVVNAWARRFPALRIVVEHISDLRTLELLDHYRVHGTITAHHLLLTGDDLMGPPLHPHRYCMPVLKRPADRDALVQAAIGETDPRWGRKLMLGTDSAPHPAGRKEAAECCAGCFTAPIAIQLAADVFDRAGALDKLQAFCSDNARRIYGLELPEKTVRLVRRPFRVPERYGNVVPLFAGEEIPWSIVDDPAV